MSRFKNLGIALAVLLFCAGCASKKVAVQKGAEVVKNDVKTEERIETKTIEVIKTEKVVAGDTIRKTLPSAKLKEPAGVVIENEAQRITINYDGKSDSFIIQGVQKVKKEIQEIRREIQENKAKSTDDKSQIKKETRNETPLPPSDEGWSGVEWGFFWACAAAVLWLIWTFRGGIGSFVKKIF